ncbi:MAG TPA: hypothetical protein VI299_20785 [Polyangiales bacterium]
MRICNVTKRSALFALALLSAQGVSAQPPSSEGPVERESSSGFGARKQLAISSDAALTIQRRTQSGAGGSVTSITLAPAADYFLFKGFSVGGFIGLEYNKAGKSHGTRFSLGPRVGYNVWLSEHWSLWPKLGFSYAHTSTSGDIKQDAVALNVFAPFVFHPVSHFFAGFGPFVDTDLNGDNRATVWGAKLTIGGWL